MNSNSKPDDDIDDIDDDAPKVISAPAKSASDSRSCWVTSSVGYFLLSLRVTVMPDESAED